MKLVLGLSLLLITSSRHSHAQDDSLAGSFLSGTQNSASPIRNQMRAKSEPYLLLLNISAPSVCYYVCLRNGIFRNLIYANRPQRSMLFLSRLIRFLMELSCSILIGTRDTLDFPIEESWSDTVPFIAPFDTMTQFSIDWLWCEIF